MGDGSPLQSIDHVLFIRSCNNGFVEWSSGVKRADIVGHFLRASHSLLVLPTATIPEDYHGGGRRYQSGKILVNGGQQQHKIGKLRL